MNSIFSLANSKNLGEQVYEQLRESIVTLQLLPGQVIQENDLGKALGVSRTPIRDAFQLLISEKLVHVLPQRTKTVAFISVTKVLESSIVRLSLESTAFKLAANLWGQSPNRQETEKQIKTILQHQQEAANSQNIKQFLHWDEVFHRTILQFTGNSTLLEVVYHMRGHLDRFRYLAMKELVLTEQLVKEHQEILGCLQQGDEVGVIQLLTQHLSKLEGEIPPLRDQFPEYFQD